MPYMTASSFFGLGKETSRGTAHAATVWLPCEAPQTEPKPTYLDDTGLRGSPVTEYDSLVGVMHNETQVKGALFPDTIQHLLLATLGGPDTVAGMGPYTHTVPLLNSASTGSQPPSYSLYDYDGTDFCRRMLGSQMDELTLTFGADAALMFQTKWITNPQTDVSVPTPTFSSVVFVPAWDTTVTIDSGSVATIQTGELTLKRSTAPIHTLGLQGPYFNFAGKIQVTGKMTMVYESGNAVLAAGTSRTQHIWVLLFTEPVSGATLSLTMSQVQYKNPKIERGKEYVEVSCDILGEANVTDAVSGYSPITTVTTNSVSAAA